MPARALRRRLLAGPRAAEVPAVKRAWDDGQPRVRVRRLEDKKRWRTRARYEVELTHPGATEPTWTRETFTPVTTIDPHPGVADAHAVVDAADRAWQGGTGPWESLYPGSG